MSEVAKYAPNRGIVLLNPASPMLPKLKAKEDAGFKTPPYYVQSLLEWEPANEREAYLKRRMAARG